MGGLDSGRGSGGQSGLVACNLLGYRRIGQAACENAEAWVSTPEILNQPTWAESQIILMQEA